MLWFLTKIALCGVVYGWFKRGERNPGIWDWFILFCVMLLIICSLP